MPSGPRLFDDGDDPADFGPDTALPPPSTGRSSRPEDPPATRRSRTDRPQRSGRPNYLVRRGIVVGGVVAVLATASVVIGQLIGSGGDGDTSGAVPAEWDRIVLLDERTGRVTVMDSDGEEVGRLDSDVATPTGSGVVADSMMVVSTENVAVLDLARAGEGSTGSPHTDAAPASAPSTDATGATDSPTDSATETTDESAEPDTDGATTRFGFGADTVTIPAGSALTMIAPRVDAGRGVLVHGPSGDIIDTDSFAPVVGARYEFASARANPSGRNVLVTDSGNFQSVLFSFDRDQPSFFPGLALAVNDEVVITAQNVGTDATVNVFDHSGEALSTGRTSAVRAGMVAGDRAVLVTVDGAVITMDIASGDTSEADGLDIGTIAAGYVTTNGDRLVVSGADGTAVVDGDGGTIGTYSGAHLADDEVPPAGSHCVALVPVGSDPEPQLTVVNTTDGNSVVDAVDAGVAAQGPERTPLRSDASGCTVAVPTSSGVEFVTSDGTQFIPTNDTLIALAPDAAKVVVVRTGRLLLVDPFSSSADTAAPIDVGREGGVIHFTQS